MQGNGLFFWAFSCLVEICLQFLSLCYWSVFWVARCSCRAEPRHKVPLKLMGALHSNLAPWDLSSKARAEPFIYLSVYVITRGTAITQLDGSTAEKIFAIWNLLWVFFFSPVFVTDSELTARSKSGMPAFRGSSKWRTRTVLIYSQWRYLITMYVSRSHPLNFKRTRPDNDQRPLVRKILWLKMLNHIIDEGRKAYKNIFLTATQAWLSYR